MRALLLDFDGVIVDSEHLHDQALRAVCAPLGFDWPGEPFIGWSDADVLRHLHAARDSPLTARALDDLLARKTEVVLRQVRAGLYRAYPGAIELIEAASEAGPVGVCSAGMRAQIEPVLAQLGVLPRLSTIVSVEDVALSKPDPAPYLLAAERLALEPRSCVAIEDSPRGVTAAKGAGCFTIAVAHTTSPAQLAHADHILTSLSGVTPPDLAAMLRERR